MIVIYMDHIEIKTTFPRNRKKFWQRKVGGAPSLPVQKINEKLLSADQKKTVSVRATVVETAKPILNYVPSWRGKQFWQHTYDL